MKARQGGKVYHRRGERGKMVQEEQFIASHKNVAEIK
jgi:hypothetical protein